MIVPEFWAESRLQYRKRGRQITLLRFGWSDQNLAAAQAMADARVREAMQQALEGNPVASREPRVPYNGADGVPIREEIVSRHRDAVITRNGYGALCLNTDNLLFIDIDTANSTGCAGLAVISTFGLAAIAAARWIFDAPTVAFVGFIVLLVGLPLSYIVKTRIGGSGAGRAESKLRRTMDKLLNESPEWNFRLYRTPAGFRVAVTHQIFEADDPEVERCFRLFHADRQYARMCRNQKCFRARVSPKPWRIGISEHIRPRRRAWPIRPEDLPERNRWVSEYEIAARNFSACRLIESVGSGTTAETLRPVIQLHDDLSGAESDRPIA